MPDTNPTCLLSSSQYDKKAHYLSVITAGDNAQVTDAFLSEFDR